MIDLLDGKREAQVRTFDSKEQSADNHQVEVSMSPSHEIQRMTFVDGLQCMCMKFYFRHLVSAKTVFAG